MSPNSEAKQHFLKQRIESLSPLVTQLKMCRTWQDKCDALNAFHLVKEFLDKPNFVWTFLSDLPLEYEVAVKSVIAIGQAPRVFSFPPDLSPNALRFKELLETLTSLENFYAEFGGIAGYHLMMLQLLVDQFNEPDFSTSKQPPFYHRVSGIDISECTTDVKKMIRWGLESMEQTAEIYPVGGAADRLKLFDEKTKIALPAARLLFLGKTLLEGIVEDLQAREYLYYKLFKKQICTPIAMMTSKEKDNHAQIVSICEEKKWFGRPKDSFFFFCQPSVPTMNKNGEWCLQEPLQLLLKPGGHGVIWKLARDYGAFDWLFEQGRKKVIVRQINNPVAGCDYGLLAFLGLGCHFNKGFGFASCPRFVKAAEGMNILIEKNKEGCFEYVLTNIEYCDFEKYQLVDEPSEKGGNFSKFPSNTNILFADLNTVLKGLSSHPIPGMLINLKKSTFLNEAGEVREEEVARLESTMQNIADAFVETFESPLDPSLPHILKTFMTFNHRYKTISAIKREHIEGTSPFETPEGCFLDIQKNAQHLLLNDCHTQWVGNEESNTMLPFVLLYHPALGPFYSIIAQKVKNNRLHHGSECQFHISELSVEALDLNGSLLIQAECIAGDYLPGSEVFRYSENTGKCTLKNVVIENEGIDWKAKNVFWKGEVFRREACSILIQGNGEFYAENVVIKGNQRIVVEKGTKVTAFQEEDRLKFRCEAIDEPTWWWEYTFSEDDEIRLTNQKNQPTPKNSEPSGSLFRIKI